MAGLTSPYEAPDLYDLVFETFDVDLRFWLEVGRNAGGPVLEVACGTGRILLVLRAAGVDVDGLDRYPAMLARLQAKAKDRGLAAHVVEADMRDFTMPRRYARVILPFNAFAHNTTIDEQLACLRCCREHLAPGGALVIHMSYPGPALWLGPDGEPVLELEVRHPVSGNTLSVYDTRFKDTVGQFQRSEVEIRETGAGGQVLQSQHFETTQRWVYPHEFELLMRLAGFSRWEIAGGFDGEPLDSVDAQMIAWGWND